MRLIDADTLDEEIKKMIHPMSTPDGAGMYDMEINVYNEAVVDVLATIGNQPTVREWIPVEERLPKWGERVLTCDAKGNIHIMTELKIPGKPFGVGENHPRFFPVVAWMPLPEPYRPEGGENEL